MPAACGCEGAGLIATVRADVDRYLYYLEVDGTKGLRALLQIAILSPGLWALLSYRLAHHAARIRPRPLSAAASVVTQLGQQIILALTGIRIDPDAHIGPGLMIPHSGHIVVGPVRIGRCCDVLQGVTLEPGTADQSPADQPPCEAPTPVLGDRVWVGPGAVITGGVVVSSDASIGANSVVTRDVPPRGVMIGVPARLISRKGSFAQVRYRGMLQDAERSAANDGVAPTGSEG
jgi:serine O-acetyltransferase